MLHENELSQFLSMLKNEYQSANNLYGKEEITVLGSCYSKAMQENYYSYFAYQYTNRFKHFLKHVNAGMAILDAGCGVGTESMLCGLLGARVIGSDILDYRINLAKARLKYYEHLLGKKLNVSFRLENIFKNDGKYDLIWANESISHIDPLEKFIEFSYGHLNNKGKLIIAEHNPINPYVYLTTKAEQRNVGSLITTEKDPDTNEDVSYAVERTLTLKQLKNILETCNFKVVQTNNIGFFPLPLWNIGPGLCTKLENSLMEKVYPLKSLSAAYILVAEKC